MAMQAKIDAANARNDIMKIQEGSYAVSGQMKKVIVQSEEQAQDNAELKRQISIFKASKGLSDQMISQLNGQNT